LVEYLGVEELESERGIYWVLAVKRQRRKICIGGVFDGSLEGKTSDGFHDDVGGGVLNNNKSTIMT
jgi:hypothetical protein